MPTSLHWSKWQPLPALILSSTPQSQQASTNSGASRQCQVQSHMYIQHERDPRAVTEVVIARQLKVLT